LELEARAEFGRGEGGLDAGVGPDLQAVRVEEVLEVALLVPVRLLRVEEALVEADLSPGRIRGHPVQGALHLASVRRAAAAALGIVAADELDHLTGVILHHLLAADEVGAAQPALAPGGQPEEALLRLLLEVLP